VLPHTSFDTRGVARAVKRGNGLATRHAISARTSSLCRCSRSVRVFARFAQPHVNLNDSVRGRKVYANAVAAKDLIAMSNRSSLS